MIYDLLGNERGWIRYRQFRWQRLPYSRQYVGQEVTLVAYPNGGAEFGINDDQKDKVVLGALKSGPRFHLVQSGKTVFEQPPAG
jgi:hypothetical protein